ncbi:MAG: DUF2236 domain-containing protein [Acidimicrobiales bacterium]|nr:DUF2236 domain-containing protein [Acidimicrobiales bacterium]
MAAPPPQPPSAGKDDSALAATARNLGFAFGSIVPSQAVESVELGRIGLQQGIVKTLGGDTDRERPKPTADGLFAEDHPVRVVHGDAAMLIGGLRALLFQTLHPLAIAGVTEHSDYKHDPLGRLHRTGNFVGVTTYGSAADADRMIRMVRKIHTKVTGIAPDGRPYEANDPHLLNWVHCTEVDSFLTAYRQYGADDLGRRQRDAYVAGMAEIATRLGVDEPPRSETELAEQLAAFRVELRANAQSADTARWLLNPPLPAAAKTTYPLIAAAAITSLPPYARKLLRLPALPLVEPLLIKPAATALTRTLGWILRP